MGYSDANDWTRLTIPDLMEMQLDKSVKPQRFVVGIAGKDSGGTWEYIRVSADGSLSNTDAANFRVSSIGGSITTAPLSADSSSVSAKQSDAANLRISAFSNDAGLLRVSAVGGSTVSFDGDAANNRVSAVQKDAANLNVSAKSGDAALFRVSAVGGTAGDNVLVDGTDQSLSATVQRTSGSVSAGANALVVYAQNRSDAGQFRVSGFIDSGSVSAKSTDAGTNLVSAKQGDAALLRVSAILDNGSVSAKSGDANQLHVSAVQGDAGLLLVSGKSDSAGQLRVSSFSNDGALNRVSAVQDGAAALNVSAKSNDAGLLRVSARTYGDTTGGWTIYRTLNVSASQAVKATAGSIYGWYLYNNDDVNQYIKFYNTSGAINVGTDTPLLTVLIPPSAAANMEFAGGLKGFTNGIGIAATSGAPDDNTAASPASAVGANIFYV